MTLKPKREKKCRAKGCGKAFKAWNSTQTACSPSCALTIARQKQEREKQEELKRRRRRTREQKEALKSVPDLIKEAQTAFNAYIRLRDEGLPCISCGTTDPPTYHGGAWDCGHYLTRGAHPELRFEESNAHRQCKACNGGSGRFAGKGRTVQEEYRERLIQRIGLEQVEWLEGPHTVHKWTKDELREIRTEYRRKARELRKQR